MANRFRPLFRPRSEAPAWAQSTSGSRADSGSGSPADTVSPGGSLWKPVGPPGGDGPAGAAPVWVGHDPSARFPIYTRGNAGEVYPEVFTPLSFSVASEAGERAMRNALLATGLVRPAELEDIPITTAVGSGVFGGYAYLNLSIQRLIAARAPGGKANDADVNLLGVGEPPPHEPLPNERNLLATMAGIRCLWRIARRQELPELLEDQGKVDRYLDPLTDPSSAPDHELRESIDDLMPLFAELFERHLIVSFNAGLMVAVLSNICERQLDDPTLPVQLLAGLGEVDSAAPSQVMWDLSRLVNGSEVLSDHFDRGVDDLLDRLRSTADGGQGSGGGTDGDAGVREFLERFASFLERFGSRGPNEWDTAFDSWETDPALALTLIDRMRGTDPSHEPSLRLETLSADSERLRRQSTADLPRPLRPLFNRVLESAKLYSRSRERSKTTVIRAIHGARLRAMELDRRLVRRSGGQKGDLWFLLDDEIDRYLEDPASCGEVIAERRETHRALRERVPPFFFDGHQPPLEQWELRTAQRETLEPGDVITGLAGCPGVARGRARVVTDPADPRGLQPGDVLIAPLTDPAWTPLFVPAEGVVVDVGALMSHAVIVSRELGIPCVVSATEATMRIPDGALIEVDGTRGTVTIVEPPEAERLP